MYPLQKGICTAESAENAERFRASRLHDLGFVALKLRVYYNEGYDQC